MALQRSAGARHGRDPLAGGDLTVAATPALGVKVTRYLCGEIVARGQEPQ